MSSVPDEVRLQELFGNPQYTGTDEEWDTARNTVVYGQWAQMNGLSYVTVVCPHCTWVNEHGTGNGHRDCDGPVMSRYTPTFDSRPGYQMYECPGYTVHTSGYPE